MRFRLILVSLFLVCMAGCGQSGSEGEWQVHGDLREATATHGPVITIGDIEPDLPTNRMQKLRPLADHIAAHLGLTDSQVRVRIARSVQEIIGLMKEGEVDIYIDSSYPVLLVSEASAGRILLESPVAGDRSYHSMLVSDRSRRISSLKDLEGKTIALQEYYSTSGFLLPAATLVEQGFYLQHLFDHTKPEGNNVGFFFSGGEENTLSLVVQGKVDAGAVSSTDWELLSPGVRDELDILVSSPEVPRKLMIVRNGLESDLQQKVVEALLAITDGQRKEMVEQTGWSWEFLPLDETSREGIEATRKMIANAKQVVVH